MEKKYKHRSEGNEAARDQVCKAIERHAPQVLESLASEPFAAFGRLHVQADFTESTAIPEALTAWLRHWHLPCPPDDDHADEAERWWWDRALRTLSWWAQLLRDIVRLCQRAQDVRALADSDVWRAQLKEIERRCQAMNDCIGKQWAPVPGRIHTTFFSGGPIPFDVDGVRHLLPGWNPTTESQAEARVRLREVFERGLRWHLEEVEGLMNRQCEPTIDVEACVRENRWPPCVDEDWPLAAKILITETINTHTVPDNWVTDFQKPATKYESVHFEWLARAHFRGEEPSEMAGGGNSRERISMAIQRTAKIVGLELRRSRKKVTQKAPKRRGRPKGPESPLKIRHRVTR